MFLCIFWTPCVSTHEYEAILKNATLKIGFSIVPLIIIVDQGPPKDSTFEIIFQFQVQRQEETLEAHQVEVVRSANEDVSSCIPYVQR